MQRPSGLTLVALLALGLARFALAGENWPQWRGPQGNGISDSTNLPTTWSLEENIVWKTALPSWSGGTPVVWGDRVFVTSPTKAQGNEAASQESPKPSNPSPQRKQSRRPGGGYGEAR